MYVYVKSEPGLWTVGFYKPDGSWESESDHESSEAAAKRVAWLNGTDTEALRECLRIAEAAKEGFLEDTPKALGSIERTALDALNGALPR